MAADKWNRNLKIFLLSDKISSYLRSFILTTPKTGKNETEGVKAKYLLEDKYLKYLAASHVYFPLPPNILCYSQFLATLNCQYWITENLIQCE